MNQYKIYYITKNDFWAKGAETPSGYKSIVACDEEDALDKFTEQFPGLILMSPCRCEVVHKI